MNKCIARVINAPAVFLHYEDKKIVATERSELSAAKLSGVQIDIATERSEFREAKCRCGGKSILWL
jgi:hypothetical protein